MIERLRPGLLTFTDDAGRELFDLPDAPRPDPDIPAPVRFLPDFDNLLLSHTDRSRVVGDADFGAQGFGADSQVQPSSVLVDGMVAATWRIGHVRGTATLTVRAFRAFTPAERDAMVAESAALLGFLHPRATPDIRLVDAG